MAKCCSLFWFGAVVNWRALWKRTHKGYKMDKMCSITYYQNNEKHVKSCHFQSVFFLLQFWEVHSNLFLLSTTWDPCTVRRQCQILQALCDSLSYALLHSQMFWSADRLCGAREKDANRLSKVPQSLTTSWKSTTQVFHWATIHRRRFGQDWVPGQSMQQNHQEIKTTS